MESSLRKTVVGPDAEFTGALVDHESLIHGNAKGVIQLIPISLDSFLQRPSIILSNADVRGHVTNVDPLLVSIIANSFVDTAGVINGPV